MSHPTMMKPTRGSTACNGTSTPVVANGDDDDERRQMSEAVADGTQVVLRRKKRGFTERPTHRQEPSTSTSNVTPNHKRRWSVHYCQGGTPPVVMVNKNPSHPQPPERSASLPQPHDAVKRYSCPPMRSLTSPRHSSSSSTSSYSSPPVKTSVITGRDPLGWKLNPKSGSSNNRLSLQIPLPIIPDLSPPKPEPSPRTKPPLKPKPSRRHSDSAALLRSLRNPLPVVTLDEICAVRLRPRAPSDKPDDVFSDGNEDDDTVTTRKTPPPVPEKTATARQTAHLIASSRRGCRPDAAASSRNIHADIVKPKMKYSHQNVNCNGVHATNDAMQHLHISCDSERSPPPHFPGYEI